jgi:cytochrome c-type biogenesis protein CcmH
MTAQRALILVALVAVAATVAWSARPYEPTAGERVDRITSEIRCVTCQGLSVKDSPAASARQMRDLVAQRVAEGRSDDEIRAEFRQAYGEWIFLSPPLFDARGLVWVFPLAAIVAGVLLVAGRLGRAPPVAPVTPEQIALLSERSRAEEAVE